MEFGDVQGTCLCAWWSKGDLEESRNEYEVHEVHIKTQKSVMHMNVKEA